jgi:uncharacterized protein
MTTENSDGLNVQTSEGQAMLKSMGVRPVPIPDDLTRPYWEAAKRHELRIQHCTVCGEYQHPPAPRCLLCSAADLEWALLSGKGVVFSFIIDMRLMTPGFDQPYAVAQVAPVETGSDRVRLTTNFRGCEIEDVYVDMPVEVCFEDISDTITLPQFRPAAEAKLRSRGQDPSG